MKDITRNSILLFLILLTAGCSRTEPPAVAVTVDIPTTATATPTATPFVLVMARPSPSPSPPVRHVAARPSATPTLREAVKTAVNLAVPVQTQRWEKATIKPAWQIAVDKKVMLYLRTKDRYVAVEKMRSDGVPAPVIFALHYREADNDVSCHLHNGDTLLRRTRHVPAGRLPLPKQPPFDWRESAADALYVCDHLQGPWDTIQWSLNKIRDYNGRGYDVLGVENPYLYSGTQFYSHGKFSSDGRYVSTAIDQQIGVVPILKRLQERGVEIRFDR